MYKLDNHDICDIIRDVDVYYEISFMPPFHASSRHITLRYTALPSDQTLL